MFRLVRSAWQAFEDVPYDRIRKKLICGEAQIIGTVG